MIPLYVLAISFVVFLVLGRFGVAPLRDWVTCLRWALAAMGLGFIAYGVDQAVHAWCRRIRSPI